MSVQVSGIVGLLLLALVVYLLWTLASSILSVTLGQLLVLAAVFASGYAFARVTR